MTARAFTIEVGHLINILVAIGALLQALAGLSIVPPSVVPYVLLAVALINVVLRFLRGEPLVPFAQR